MLDAADKKMCGLWHEHVENSEHNDFGKCKCLQNCFGNNCHSCRRYHELQHEIAFEYMAAFKESRESRDDRCTLCRRCKTR